MRLAGETFCIDFVDILSARGPSRKPAALCDNLQPANGSIISRSSRQFGSNGLAREIRLPDRIGRELLQFRLLLLCSWRIDPSVVRITKLRCQFLIMLPRIFSGMGGNLGGKQIHDWTILVCRPYSPVSAEETCSRTLLAAEAERPVDQSGDKPFETHRHLRQLASELCNDTVDHAAAHQSLSHHDVLVPLRTMGQKILDCNS